MWSELFAGPVQWRTVLLAVLPTLAVAWLAAHYAGRLVAAGISRLVGEALEPTSVLVRTPRRLGTVHVFANGAITTLANKSKDFSHYVIGVNICFNEDPDRVSELVRDVDALLCGIAWVIGADLLALYASFGDNSAYGALGGLLVVMVWMKFVSQLLFYGAEVCKVVANGAVPA